MIQCLTFPAMCFLLQPLNHERWQLRRVKRRIAALDKIRSVSVEEQGSLLVQLFNLEHTIQVPSLNLIKSAYLRLHDVWQFNVGKYAIENDR